MTGSDVASGGMIAVAGEALVDLVPAPQQDAPEQDAAGRLPTAVPGGSPANVAVGLARLGVPARLLARISSDPHGQLIREHLVRNGVDLSHAVPAAEPTSVAVVTVDADGSPSYDFRVQGTADWQWSDAELGGALDADPEAGEIVAVQSGSLALTMAPGAGALRRLLERARKSATVCYDPNCRPELMGEPAQVLAGVYELLGIADVVKVSAEDLHWLLPGQTPAEIVADWAGRGPLVVVLTMGAEGALAAAGTGLLHRPAPAVRVVDTVGAGDAFTAALLAGMRRRDLLGAGRRGALQGLEQGGLAALVDDANLAAALTCTRRGADPPTAADFGI